MEKQIVRFREGNRSGRDENNQGGEIVWLGRKPLKYHLSGVQRVPRVTSDSLGTRSSRDYIIAYYKNSQLYILLTSICVYIIANIFWLSAHKQGALTYIHT